MSAVAVPLDLANTTSRLSLPLTHSPADYQKCWQSLPRLFDPSQRDYAGLIKAGADSGMGGTAGSAQGWVTDGGVSVSVAAASSSSGSSSSSSSSSSSGAGAGSSNGHQDKKRKLDGTA